MYTLCIFRSFREPSNIFKEKKLTACHCPRLLLHMGPGHWSSHLRRDTDTSRSAYQASQETVPPACPRASDKDVRAPSADSFRMWRSGGNSNPKGTSQLFPVESHTLGVGGVVSHPNHFTLGCKLPQYLLYVLARAIHRNYVICKKQRQYQSPPAPGCT